MCTAWPRERFPMRTRELKNAVLSPSISRFDAGRSRSLPTAFLQSQSKLFSPPLRPRVSLARSSYTASSTRRKRLVVVQRIDKASIDAKSRLERTVISFILDQQRRQRFRSKIGEIRKTVNKLRRWSMIRDKQF